MRHRTIRLWLRGVGGRILHLRRVRNVCNAPQVRLWIHTISIDRPEILDQAKEGQTQGSTRGSRQRKG